jgi:hypothetical protein
MAKVRIRNYEININKNGVCCEAQALPDRLALSILWRSAIIKYYLKITKYLLLITFSKKNK